MKKKIAFIILITTVFVATGIMANTYIYSKKLRTTLLCTAKKQSHHVQKCIKCRG